MLGVELRTGPDPACNSAVQRGLSSALTGRDKANAKRASHVLRATVRPNLAFNTDAPLAARDHFIFARRLVVARRLTWFP